MKQPLIVLLLLSLVFGLPWTGELAACQQYGPVVWRLSEAPRTTIGVVAGDPSYELHRATSSLLQASGNIVVSNAGSLELRAFSSDGIHLWTAGGRGEGPGEFRWPSRVLPFAGDSLIVHDFAGDRMSVFDAQGVFGRTDSLVRSIDKDFPLVVWLYNQYWLDGPRDISKREQIRHVLDRLPVPRGKPAYRFAFVDDQLNIWVRTPSSPLDEAVEWTVYDQTPVPIAVVKTPQRFEVHEVGESYVLGRWLDGDGVNFIHLYDLEKTSEYATLPDDAPHPVMDGEPRADQDDRLRAEGIAAIRQGVMSLVMAQEGYWANNSEYSANRHDLTWEAPEGVGMDIVRAAPFGWTAVFTHAATQTICGVFVGAAGPPGWVVEAEPKCR